MKEIILKVCNDKIYFNPELSIPIQQTNIPKEHLTFRTHRDIFWKVEMLNYNTNDQLLNVSILDYNLSDGDGFTDQIPKKKVKQLIFKEFEWNKLEPLLTFYQESKLKQHMLIQPLAQFFDQEIAYFNIVNFNQNTPSSINQQIQYNQNVEPIKLDFRVFFSDLHFILGYATFKKYIKELDREVEFKIANDHILAEFDNIKSWFAKKLRIKKIRVSVTIVLTENGISETQALSDDIDEITPELIDSVKYERTYALSKATGISDLEKLLFTVDDIFSQIDSDNIERNVFNQSDENILNFFLQKKDIRNKRQLEYLAGNKQSENHKLRYTLNPDFGFLFMIEGPKYNHYVWELLNSNATYLWRINKGEREIELQFKIVEGAINTIRTNGRRKYKLAYQNNLPDKDFGFILIAHEEINSNPDDNFPKWKSRLNEQLT